MLAIILTINTYFTSILAVPPNLLVIYFSITSGIKEIPEYRFIIIVQAISDILNSVILSIISMVRNISIHYHHIHWFIATAEISHFFAAAFEKDV